jgi:hypothetical protein
VPKRDRSQKLCALPGRLEPCPDAGASRVSSTGLHGSRTTSAPPLMAPAPTSSGSRAGGRTASQWEPLAGSSGRSDSPGRAHPYSSPAVCGRTGRFWGHRRGATGRLVARGDRAAPRSPAQSCRQLPSAETGRTRDHRADHAPSPRRSTHFKALRSRLEPIARASKTKRGVAVIAPSCWNALSSPSKQLASFVCSA